MSSPEKILLIHGFTGHPDDLKPLDEAFTHQGYECIRPMLKGHGTNLEDLNRTQASEWISQLKDIQADVLVGLSMGALLAIILASKHPFKKIILLSPAFVLKSPGRFGVFLSQCGLYRLLPKVSKKPGGDILSAAGRKLAKSYPAVPIKALGEFEKIRQQALEVLPEVKTPIDAFFGSHDHTVNIKASSKLVSNPVFLKNSAHILPLDTDQEKLISQCQKILETSRP